jgi:hypothetical protein
MRKRLWIGLALTFAFTHAIAQKSGALVYVDKEGVMRYTKGKQEASFFGVNYTTPFAHAYRAQKAQGIDLEQAIRNDVYHFARLGLQAFRVHVWDTEISDTAGNLLENEHLRLFDFLLAELKKRNIRSIITPIAFWGNGYPERDEPTPGFSRYFGRGKLTTNDTAIRAQENYLRQFFQHVNPYTGLRYQDDPDIIATEINNEPAHSGPKAGVTNYIKRLAKTIRATGWRKPVFYNIAQGPYYSDAVANADVQGLSFQWYPAGLVSGATLQGNTLPHVDQYKIPFRDTVPAFRNKALMVYEFDAADIAGSYMYPFMAKAFREAGFQWATQFAYDPLAIAGVNTEYQTHYLNLAYTPSKAISLMIAAEAFSRIPRRKSYGTYPADSSFDAFTVSYDRHLSEMNSGDKYYYTNNTNTQPMNPAAIRHIAGVGSSPLVHYSGSGAYFLDKLADGVWRLELMPDAVALQDPFEKTSPRKPVTGIVWRKNAISIQLEDLGSDFRVEPLLADHSIEDAVNNNTVSVKPGLYLLVRKGVEADTSRLTMPGAIGLRDFVAPAATPMDKHFQHQPPVYATADQTLTLTATIAGWQPDKVQVEISRKGWGRGRQMEMQANGYEYTAAIPADWVGDGELRYRFILQKDGNYHSYPANSSENPYAWDAYQADYYSLTVRKPGASIDLFHPSRHDRIFLTPNWRRGFQSGFISGEHSGDLLYQLRISDLAVDEVMGLQHYIGDVVNGIGEEFQQSELRMRVRAVGAEATDLRVALVNKWGTAFAATVQAGSDWQEISVPIHELQKAEALLLPRPYPGFQPLQFISSETAPVFRWKDMEQLQLQTLPLHTSVEKRDVTIEIAWIRMASSH